MTHELFLPDAKLCYICPDRNVAYFTMAPMDKQWGDDWDDAPYEHNAGSPYTHNGESVTCIRFRCNRLVTPNHMLMNSEFSVQAINGGAIPWMRPEPDGDGEAPEAINAGDTVREFVRKLYAADGAIIAEVDLDVIKFRGDE